LLFKFEGHWVFIRRSTHGFLTILTSEMVNFPALKMASNVALKQVNDHFVAHPDLLATAPAIEPEEAAPTPPVAAPAAAETAPETTKKRRMWRGQWLD
ncbi:MAG TPA: hypothetical protein VFG14_12845, partial [Chthoniobacteraceae bacterium]|nr:hypothetical protein [Chthoniobacteraceae bacterium]